MNPRPHVAYWTFCFVYLEVALLIKALLRVFYPCQAAAEYSLIIGWLCETQGYFYDIVFDLVCVLVVMWHQTRLTAWGLWNDDALAVASGEVPPSMANATDEPLSSAQLLIDAGGGFNRTGTADDPSSPQDPDSPAPMLAR